jgi:hypothetical protein
MERTKLKEKQINLIQFRIDDGANGGLKKWKEQKTHNK